MSENYWTKIYGFRSKAFIEGVIAGIEAFAFWKDGVQVIGTLEEPLDKIIAEVKEGLGWKEADDDK